MTQYDAIIVGAGHNGLAAGVLLQEAGLRTAILEAKRYAGGMASTVELFDGFHFEIAGSLQFPTSAVVSEALGLGNLPTVELEVMSVSTRVGCTRFTSRTPKPPDSGQTAKQVPVNPVCPTASVSPIHA